MAICITGTPGTGKSVVACALAKKMRLPLLQLNQAVVEHKLYSGYDRKRKSYIADDKKMRRFVAKLIKENKQLIVEGHLAHFLPTRFFEKIIVLRCSPDELARRLARKRWSKAKINENVEAEMISLISVESRNRHKNVYEIDTTKRSVGAIANDIARILKVNGARFRKQIDWLQ